MERVKGIEPSYLAWEARALPLSYTRIETLPTGLLYLKIDHLKSRKFNTTQTIKYNTNDKI